MRYRGLDQSVSGGNQPTAGLGEIHPKPPCGRRQLPEMTIVLIAGKMGRLFTHAVYDAHLFL